jgi:hypothetical protein
MAKGCIGCLRNDDEEDIVGGYIHYSAHYRQMDENETSHKTHHHSRT